MLPFQCALVAIITATLFLRTTLSPDNVLDGGLYLGVLFFSLLFMMFSGFTNVTITVRLFTLLSSTAP
jgi:hypothetical protein